MTEPGLIPSRHTYNMGVIGNCAYLAYINNRANIDWLCWPRFDSSFLFGGLLSPSKGGGFSVHPEDEHYASRQYYIQNTNVLCTEFTTSHGKFEVVDFAPRFFQFERHFKPLVLVRKIHRIEGHPRVVVQCDPRGDYGEVTPSKALGSNHIRFIGLEDKLRLWTNMPVHAILEHTPITLGETIYLYLSWAEPLEAPLETTAESFLKKTIHYWRIWCERCSIPNLYQEEVLRSALVLKLHQFEDSGAIIASGTTSLPESPFSGRNWDYRYFWLRDSYYTLSALNSVSHFDELKRYAGFVQNIAYSSSPPYQPVYSILGNANLVEKELSLEGYLGNQPVRIGNAAYAQAQYDVAGQIILSLLPLYTDHRFVDTHRVYSVQLIERLLDSIASTMDLADAGIWEFRNSARRHCYTYLFHWAGASAALKIGQALCQPQLVQRAQALIVEASRQIEACYDPINKCYMSSVGGTEVDASLLQLIIMKYLDPSSQRARDHLKALEQNLKADGGLFYRYLHADDFGKSESSFFVCSFWYVIVLSMMDRLDEAMQTFERLLQYGNHLNLLSEDVDPRDGSQWGNFPQTYSHVGLINAAFSIAQAHNCPAYLQTIRPSESSI